MSTAPTAEAVASNVRAEMGRQRMSTSALAKSTGIARSTLSAKINGDTAFSVAELASVAAVLGLPVADLFATSAA